MTTEEIEVGKKIMEDLEVCARFEKELLACSGDKPESGRPIIDYSWWNILEASARTQVLTFLDQINDSQERKLKERLANL